MGSRTQLGVDTGAVKHGVTQPSVTGAARKASAAVQASCRSFGVALTSRVARALKKLPF